MFNLSQPQEQVSALNPDWKASKALSLTFCQIAESSPLIDISGGEKKPCQGIKKNELWQIIHASHHTKCVNNES